MLHPILSAFAISVATMPPAFMARTFAASIEALLDAAAVLLLLAATSARR
jgi:hypothetical protein